MKSLNGLTFSGFLLSSITKAIAMKSENITIGIIWLLTTDATGLDGKKSNNTFENDGISLALKPSAPTKLNPCPNLKILPIIIPIIAATPVVPSNIPSVLIPIDFKVSKF